MYGSLPLVQVLLDTSRSVSVLQEITYLRKKLQESRDAAVLDYLWCQDLPHPIPQGVDHLSASAFDEVFDEQLQTAWPAYLRWSWRLLRDTHERQQQLRQQEHLEAQEGDVGRHRPKRPRSRTWSLLPNKGFGRSAVQIESEGLAELLGSQKLSKRLRSGGYEMWWTYFRLDKVASKRFQPPYQTSLSPHGHRFYGSLRTDGVSCSVLLERPNISAKDLAARRRCCQVGADKRQYIEHFPLDARVVALDPGPKGPLTGVVNGDEWHDHQVIEVSGKQYRSEAWFGRAKQRRRNRLLGAPGMEALLTHIPGYHTPYVSDLCAHLKYVLEHLEELREFAARRIVAKDK